MNRKRLTKFKKIRDLNQKQLERIQLQLAHKQLELRNLEQERQQLQARQNQIQVTDTTRGNLTAQWQFASQLMIATQREINDCLESTRGVEGEIAEIIQRYQQQNSKLKSWEKLVEREVNQSLWEQDKREFDIADERFLSTTIHRRTT